MKEKFIYFLNAIHYCIYLEEVWTNRKAQIVLGRILLFMSNYFLSNRMRHKIKFHVQYDMDLKEYLYGKNHGQSIGLAHYVFNSFASCYYTFPSWICLGILDCGFDTLKGIISLLISTIPLFWGYNQVYNVMFNNGIYLKYFRQFEKNDNDWLKKWKLITVAFCLGGIATMAVGFLCMAMISSYSR